MRSRLLVLGLCLLAPGSPAQVTFGAPGSNQGQATRQSEAHYGPPRLIEMDALYLMPEAHQRNHVIVEAEITETGMYWSLRQGGTTVLLIPASHVDPGEFMQTAGRRIEVRGIVRMIRPKQYTGSPPVDMDLIEDPILPVLPPPSAGLPRVSITAFAIRDRTSTESFKSKETSGGGSGRQILDEPSAYSGKTTRILGQFRGRNLFGDLPAGSARGKDDWVLKDGETAVWVVGKSPKGDGWKLDLDYKGDSKSWLEVEGKPEVVNGIVYIKASKVVLRRAPDSEKSSAPPR